MNNGVGAVVEDLLSSIADSSTLFMSNAAIWDRRLTCFRRLRRRWRFRLKIILASHLVSLDAAASFFSASVCTVIRYDVALSCWNVANVACHFACRGSHSA